MRILFAISSILLRVSTYIGVGAPVRPRAAEGDELVTSSVEDEAADCDTRTSFMAAAKYVMCPTFALISLFAEAPDME